MLKEISIDKRKYLLCDKIKELGIKNFFTLSCGGVSDGNVKGLNLGFRVSDTKENVIENYKLVSKDFGIDFDSITASKQNHSLNIKVITNEDKGRGVSKPCFEEEIDGLITNEKNLPLVVYSADCYCVIFADKQKKAVGAVHSGWRGTVGGISKNLVKVMEEKFLVSPSDIVVAIGPGIGSCCFETDADVKEKFDLKYVKEKGNGKFLIDLVSKIKDDLIEVGIKEENIYSANRCSVCENDKFYSYRVQKEKTGRMGAFISL